MIRAFCPKCNREVEYKTRKNLIEEYKGVKVDVEETIAYCTECGEDIVVMDIEKENLKSLYEKYRSITGIVSPKEIVEFREKYNVSQRELVTILGWGKMTINRYERGALPSKSHSDILKAIINNEGLFKEKIEEAYNMGRINNKVYKKFNDVLKGSLKILEKQIINSKLNHPEDIYNGFRKLDLERLENLISYIADNVDNLYKTSLNKYLSFIDLSAFKEFVRSITGLRYAKLQFGPVIEGRGYEEIINFLDDKFYKEETERFDGSITTKIISKKNYDMSMFSKGEMMIINKVIDKLKYMSCGEISEESHKEIGWKNTDMDELISYDYAEDLKIKFD